MEVHGTMTIKGSNVFKVPATDFFISPLSADAKLYIRSICNGIIDEKIAADVKAEEYTKVTGSVPYVEFFINTDDKYYVKW